jgi:phosphoglucosamine mutase
MNKGKVSLQSQLAYVQKTPQVLSNVKIGHPVTTEMLNRIEPAVKDMENYLQNKGRIVIRPSGTEPVIRVMAEAFNEQDARYVTDRLVKAVKSEFNSS